MSGPDLAPWIITGLSTALSVALGVMAVITRRLGDAEGERRILREVLAAHRARCSPSSSSSSSRSMRVPEAAVKVPEAASSVDYGPVRPAGMSMAEWRRRQAGLDKEDEGAED